MRIEAKVNGKLMKLDVKKQYESYNGTVYECQTENGVWVAVEEKTVVKKLERVRTRFEYSGGEDRGVWVTLRARTEEEAEEAHEILRRITVENGYSLCDCDNVEFNKGKWILSDFIGIESPKEAKDIKETIYKQFKAAVA